MIYKKRVFQAFFVLNICIFWELSQGADTNYKISNISFQPSINFIIYGT